jgi:hypothetical protein
MKFTISHGLDPDEDHGDYDDIVIGEDGTPTRQITLNKPDVPPRYKLKHEVKVFGDAIQISYWTIEISSLKELLELSKEIGSDITLERQPEDVRNGIGSHFPEFAIVIQ